MMTESWIPAFAGMTAVVMRGAMAAGCDQLSLAPNSLRYAAFCWDDGR
jgi:hypothetical protein